jgi:hypothetical protein
MFCLLNEGFYQRQLWLIVVLADRLYWIATATPSLSDSSFSQMKAAAS